MKIVNDVICQFCKGVGTDIPNINRNGRAKGHSNERRLAKLLQKWWSPDGKYEFKRTPGSGASPLAKDWGLAGDIATTAPDWPYHVEAKREKGWSFDQLLTSEKGGRLMEYWDQATSQAKNNKIPIVIFSHPGSGSKQFVMIDKYYGESLVVMCIVPKDQLLVARGVAIFELSYLLKADPIALRKNNEK